MNFGYTSYIRNNYSYLPSYSTYGGLDAIKKRTLNYTPVGI